mgnify:CR=1 FL=1
MKIQLMLVRHNKGLIPKIIRSLTNSEWDHVAIFIPSKGLVYENDLTTGVHSFPSSWLNTKQGKDLWSVKRVRTGMCISQEQLDKFSKEKYSLWHNFKTLAWNLNWFRRSIKPEKGHSNCVGYIARAAELPEDAQFAYPHNLKEWFDGNTTQR